MAKDSSRPVPVALYGIYGSPRHGTSIVRHDSSVVNLLWSFNGMGRDITKAPFLSGIGSIFVGLLLLIAWCYGGLVTEGPGDFFRWLVFMASVYGGWISGFGTLFGGEG